jgi:glycine betaine/choline ABC-type transport system substrate-binding protein
VSRASALICLIATAMLCGCWNRQRTIVVGSKSYTEQIVLGEIVARHLENRLQTSVERKLGLGSTLLVHQLLLSGQLDVYPEYTGTALMTLLKLAPEYDRAIVYERVRQEFQRQRLVIFPPLGFEDRVAVVVRGADARAGKLETLSDAAAYEPGWILAADHEFIERPDGYALLMKFYNLPVKAAPSSVSGGAAYGALQGNQANMAIGSESDALLSELDVKLLRDDRHAFLPSQAVLAARADTLDSHPGMRRALAELSGRFTDQIVRKLGHEVEIRHRKPADVAAEFLQQAGLAPR